MISVWTISFVSKIKLSYLFWNHLSLFSSINFHDSRTDWFLNSDELLISEILNWDSEKFRLIVDKYSNKMFRYIYYHFNFSKQISEDLTQEVFLHLWNKLDKFDLNQKFEPWLYRLAHNCCLDWIRKNKSNLNEISLEEFTYNISEEDSSSDDVNTDYVKWLLYQIIDNLDFKYRQVIILFYFEQKSYEEIAFILWISKWAAWTNLNRAKLKIKEIIESKPELKDALQFDL